MTKRYIIDCEVYSNYFLMSAMDIQSKEIINFEKSEYQELDRMGLKKFMADNLTVSFNGFNYDLLIITYVLKGGSNEQIKKLSDKIIKSKLPAWKIAKDVGISVPTSWNHIDLFDVAPGKSSLKIYGGRLNEKKLQDLPIAPDAILTKEEMPNIKKYCGNDLETTRALFYALRKQIELRISMSRRYGMDLRSKGDAQIAESVIIHELEQLTGKRYGRPDITQESFRYKDPEFISFESEHLKAMFKKVLQTDFTLGGNGAVIMPDWLKKPIKVSGIPYQMGIGGLHSMESAQYVKCDTGMELADYDVASYYPSIILQQKMHPESIGSDFLTVYQNIVSRRLKAKHSGDKTTADTLKIVINSSFGKFGSKYSKFYAPHLLIQTTITGQLALLMLIERMANIGARTVSANTDGIVLYYQKSKAKLVEQIAFDWSLDTSYMLEKTPYFAIASRNVNNYVAVREDGSIKGKGCFSKNGLSKNPDFPIIYEAVAKHVATGDDVEKTIRSCADITKFVCVRRVQGGAVWRDEPLGRAVRFYYSTKVAPTEAIHYSINGNRVPKSMGAIPAMDLPEDFPNDVNYWPYIEEAKKLLGEIGFDTKGSLC